MKKTILFLCLVLMFIPLSWAKVGDILQVIKTPGPCPTGLAFDGQNLWLADNFTDKIYKIDPASGNILKSFDSPGHRPEGLTWDGQNLWHIDQGERSMYVIDPETGKTS